MKGKLKIECAKTKAADIKKLAKNVYAELGQTAKLKAEVIFVDETEIKRLNREYRNKDAVTDVLSFPTLDGIRGRVIDARDFPFEIERGYVVIGSIAINLKRAEEQAKEFGHSVEREVTYLLLHGLLHLFGYDHEKQNDKEQMRLIEKKVCRNMGIAEEDE